MSYTSKAAEEDAQLLFDSLHDPRVLRMESFPTLFAQPQHRDLQAKLKALQRTQEDILLYQAACDELMKLYSSSESKSMSKCTDCIEVRESKHVNFETRLIA